MILNVTIDDQTLALDVPDSLLTEARGFFDKMDRDLDQGWQMSREWVENPTPEQRCQVAADKLLTAVETENQNLGVLMAGYILWRLPGVQQVDIDTSGDMTATRLLIPGLAVPPRPAAPTGSTPGKGSQTPPPGSLSKIEALEQAGKDVTKVFKIGRGFRFSVFNHDTGHWEDSPVTPNKETAEALRNEAFKRKFDELTRGEG